MGVERRGSGVKGGCGAAWSRWVAFFSRWVTFGAVDVDAGQLLGSVDLLLTVGQAFGTVGNIEAEETSGRLRTLRNRRIRWGLGLYFAPLETLTSLETSDTLEPSDTLETLGNGERRWERRERWERGNHRKHVETVRSLATI